MSKGVIGYIQYRLGRVGNFHAVLVMLPHGQSVSVSMRCASKSQHGAGILYPGMPRQYLLSIPALCATSSITNVPNVTCRLNLLWSALLYSVAQVYCVLLIASKWHQLSSVSVFVLCSNVWCVLTMCLKVKSVSCSCFTKFLLTCVEKKSADAPIGFKKGGIYMVLHPPFYQLTRDYPWFFVSVSYRTGLALRGSR